MSVDMWEFASVPHDLAREVMGRSGVINRILFPSVKMNRQIHCEGDNERNAVALLEVLPDVQEYREQPSLGLSVNVDGTDREVYPDLEVVYQDGSTEIIDVVRVRHLYQDEKRAKLRRIGRRCRELGYRYRVWSDHDIGRQPRLSASNAICWSGRRELPNSLKDIETEALLCCSDLAELKGKFRTSMDEVCQLILQGHLAVGIDQGLNDASPILGPGWKRRGLR